MIARLAGLALVLVLQTNLFSRELQATSKPSKAESKKPQIAPSDELERLLADLRNEDEQTRTKSLKELEGLYYSSAGVTKKDGLMLLDQASKKLGFDKPDAGKVSAALIRLTMMKAHSEYASALQKAFENLKTPATEEALRGLLRMESKDAAQAFLAILKDHARKGKIESLPTGPLLMEKKYVNVIFPELLNYSDLPGFLAPICEVTLKHCESRALGKKELQPFTDQFVKVSQQLSKKLKASQKDNGLSLDVGGRVPRDSSRRRVLA
jgi:hypothetical protein